MTNCSLYEGTNCPPVGDVNLHRHQESAETSHIYVCSHVLGFWWFYKVLIAFSMSAMVTVEPGSVGT